jgi:SulP family sulfate permease
VAGWVAEPLVENVRAYTFGKAWGDLIAGLTVGVVAVPQCMAFALLAGVPAVYGLYSAMVQSIVSALFNSSEHVAVGPTNTQSLLIQAIAAPLAVGILGPNPDPDTLGLTYMSIAALLGLLKGLMQIAMALLNFSQLVKYVSLSVLLGFTTAAEVLIAVGQVPNFFGLEPYTGERSASGLIDAAVRTYVGIFQTESSIHWPSVGIGLMCLVIIFGFRFLSRYASESMRATVRAGGPLVAVAVAAAMAMLLNTLGMGEQGFNPEREPGSWLLVGTLPQGLPGLQMPGWEGMGLADLELLLVPALAIAVMGTLEQVAISKSMATHTGQRIDPRRECFSQGITNVVTSFFQCFAGSASFSRSALNYSAGAQTRFSSVFSGIVVAAMFLLMAPLAKFIPKASLAAVLFVVAFGLFDYKKIKRVLVTSRSDAIVCVVTFLATLLAPLVYAIYIGIALNIALYLHHASKLRIAEMVRTPGGPFQERPVLDRHGKQALVFLQLEGDLFFAVADELQDRLAEIRRSGTRVVLIRLRRTHTIDSTVLAVFDSFVSQMHAQGRSVLMCGVKPESVETFRKFGLLDRMGEENVFVTTYGVFTSCEAALRRARELLRSSLDSDPLADDRQESMRGWSYEI